MSTDSNDSSAIDAHARGPLLLLLGAGLLWLVLSGVLALVVSIQLHTPSFLADCPWFTYGRAQALRESAFVYGWLANTGLALGLWIVARLGGETMRAGNWVAVGGLFWNLGVVLSLIGIAAGDASGHGLFQIPAYTQPLLLVAHGAVAVAGILAWSGRRQEATFASQWYVFAALFLFPWLFSVAQVTLVWFPVRGVMQSIVAAWFAQGLYSLWLAPLALACAYYLLPKVTGRVLPAYPFAKVGFWTLAVVGSWTGGRHLIGGPFPAWVASMSIAACSLLLFHYLVVFLNLRNVIGSKGTAMYFTSFGLLAYLLSGVADAVVSLRGVAVQTQFTFVDQAMQQLALYGAISMMFFAALYFAVPRLVGKTWASAGLVAGHTVLASFGVALLVVALAAAGLIQGHALLGDAAKFSNIAAATRPWMLAATAAQVALLLANLMLLVNFVQTVAAIASPRVGSAPVSTPALKAVLS
jgi:cytochrome c oxidase cbb3-type subunit 1